MPQAVSIFPNVQPLPPRSNSSTSSSDSGSSKFDDMLDSARQKDATNTSQSTTASDSSATEKSRKSGKSGKSDNSGKSTSAKPAAKSTVKAKTAAPAEEENETSETEAEDERGKFASTQTAAPLPDAAAEESTGDVQKPKDAKHSSQADDPSTDEAQVLLQQQQPGYAIKPIGKDPRQSGGNPRKGAKGTTAIALASDAGDDDMEDPTATPAQGPGDRATADVKSRSSSAIDDGPVGVQAVHPDQAEGNAAASSASSVSTPSDADTPAAVAKTGASDDQATALPESQTAPVPVSHPLHAFDDILQTTQGPAAPAEKVIAASAAQHAANPAPARETEFAEANHAAIVSSVKGQLLPNGGSMQIRLDPAELGTVNISVQMRDGVMTATFDTSNDQAAKLLTHSLGQLKTALESQGVSIGGLHVQQTPRDSDAGSNERGQQGNRGSDNAATQQQKQQEQQRKDMVRRMWRRLSGGSDPLDLVA